MTATSSCANLLIRDVSNSSGIIQSSREIRYHYSNNMDCHWNLSSNTRLELTFSIFKTEALADYVAVYDGDSRSSPLIGRFSGSSLLAAIESSSNKLHVHFTTNANGKDSGFRARYRGIPFQNHDFVKENRPRRSETFPFASVPFFTPILTPFLSADSVI